MEYDPTADPHLGFGAEGRASPPRPLNPPFMNFMSFMVEPQTCLPAGRFHRLEKKNSTCRHVGNVEGGEKMDG